MNLTSIKGRETRKFGFIALIFFGCLFAIGLWFEKTLPAFLFGTLSILGLGFVLIPERLRPIYDGWLKIAHFLGRIVTIVILTLAYFLAITPLALIKRIFGGRPLPLQADKNIPSYWVIRDEPVQPKHRFLKRY